MLVQLGKGIVSYTNQYQASRKFFSEITYTREVKSAHIWEASKIVLFNCLSRYIQIVIVTGQDTGAPCKYLSICTSILDSRKSSAKTYLGVGVFAFCSMCLFILSCIYVAVLCELVTLLHSITRIF